MKRSAVGTVAQACYAAAGIVERGWLQGSYFYFEPGKEAPSCSCALGAIRIVCNTHVFSGPESNYGLTMRTEMFVRHRLLDGHSLTEFNDQADMTQDDIVALLTMAGDLATCERA